MQTVNKGFDPEEIKKFREKLKKNNRTFLPVDPDNHSEDYVQFQFIGKYEGKEVIYDAAIYTLRLQQTSEMYEIAEKKAAEAFPSYAKSNLDEDEDVPMTEEDEKIGLFIAEVLMELEEEESVKVQEQIEIDPEVEYGVALDVGLNVDEITEETIAEFIAEYNDGTFKPDPTFYSYQTDEDEDE